jgi:hypothetical protein
MFWGLFFVVAVVVAGWPIQVVTIVVIFGLFCLTITKAVLASTLR